MHFSNIQYIVRRLPNWHLRGKLGRLEENIKAAELELTPGDLREIQSE
jgi:hypothetical protein